MNESLERFTQASQTAAASVIDAYSTSFGVATRLLGVRHRDHVRNIYAMVRVADEIVDGVAHEAGLDAAAQRLTLSEYADQTHRAMERGYSSDLVLHAFAHTARASGIGPDLTQPFFTAMAADIGRDGPQSDHVQTYQGEDYDHYVYGSAEVVGLMCLKVFLRQEQRDAGQLARLEDGARHLGAAFQNVNFLRDLGDDTERLNRSYLTRGEQMSEDLKDDWVELVKTQLDQARRALPLLPKDARAAVRGALALFEALTKKVDRTPAAALYGRRVRVSDPVKAMLAARALLQTWREAEA